MNPILAIRDWIALAVVGVLVAACAWLYVSREHIRHDLDVQKQEFTEAKLKAEEHARTIERNMQTQIARVITNEEDKRNVLSGRLARADAVNVGLRDEISRLNGRPTPANPAAAAYAREASTARELLGTCADEYRGMAKNADELRDQVNGLQDYITSVLKAVQ